MILSLMGNGPKETKLVEKIYSLQAQRSELSLAKDHLETHLSKDPYDQTPWTARFMMAELLYEHRQYYGAEKLYRKLLASEPSGDDFLGASAQLRLAESLFLQSQYTGAYEQYLELRQRDYKGFDTESLIGMTACSLAYGDPETALIHAKELLEKDMELEYNPRAYFPIGLALYQNGLWEEVIGLLGEHPERPEWSYLVGLAYRKMNQTPLALALFESIRRDFSQTPWADRAAFEIAETYYLQGEDTLARQGFEKWLSEHPEGIQHNQALCRLASLDFKAKHYTQALERLSGIDPSFLDPDIMGPLLALVNTIDRESRIQLDDLTDLSQKLENELKINATNLGIIYRTAWVRVAQKQFTPALDLLEAELAKNLSDEWKPAFLTLAGFCWQMTHQDARALASYQVILDAYRKTPWAARALHMMTALYAKNGEYDRITTQVKHFWKKMPESFQKEHPEIHFWMAEAENAGGNPRQAMNSYQKFIFQAPGHRLEPYARLHLAGVLFQLKRQEQALRNLNELEKWANKNKETSWMMESTLQAAAIQFNSRHYEQAIWLYRGLRSQGNLPPAVAPWVFYREAMALSRLGYFSDAMDLWKKLAALAPEHPLAEEASFLTARTLFELGYSTQAAGAYQTFLTLYPQSRHAQEALLQTGHAFYNNRDFAAAIAPYQAYLAKYPQSQETKTVAQFLQVCYVNSGKSLEEILPLTQGAPLSSEVGDKLWREAAQAYNVKDHAKAEQLFQQMLLKFPESTQSQAALFFRAECLFALERYDEAAMAYRAYLKLPEGAPQKGMSLFRLGICQFKQNKFEESAATFENFLNLYKSDPLAKEALENLPLAHFKSGRFSNAQEAYSRLLQTKNDPADRASVLLAWAQMNELIGHFPKAFELYEMIDRDALVKSQALQGMARMYAKQGEKQKEQAVLEDLKSMGKTQ